MPIAAVEREAWGKAKGLMPKAKVFLYGSPFPMECLLRSALKDQALADQAPDGALALALTGFPRLGDLFEPSSVPQTAQRLRPPMPPILHQGVPRPRRSLTVVPLIADKRDHGETPLRGSGRAAEVGAGGRGPHWPDEPFFGALLFGRRGLAY